MVFIDKIKPVILIAAIMPALCTAHASFNMPHGIYLGPSAFVSNTTFTNNIAFDPAEVVDAPLYSRNQHASTMQVQPGFLLGYEYLVNNRWLLSAEFQASFLKSYANVSGTDYVRNEVTTNNQFAVQVRAGTRLTEAEDYIYLLAGLARSESDVNIVFDNTNLTVGALGDLQLGPVMVTRNLSGLKVGAGYEKHFSKDIGIRFDYSHTFYGSYNISLNDPVFADIFPEPLGNSTIRESTDMLGITLLLLS